MFKITVIKETSNYTTEGYDNPNQILDSNEFKTKKEAMKFKRQMIKKHNLKNTRHGYVDYNGKELETNF